MAAARNNGSSSDPRRFPDTHWSQLMAASNVADPAHVEHLNKLLQRYWKPTYHYVRAMRRLSAEDAEDLTQGFFTMILSRVDLSSLSPERGSFRGFLKTALRRFLIDQERRPPGRRENPGPPRFPFAEAEAEFPRQQAETLSPEDAFDRQWARDVMAEALERLRGELEAEGKALYYEVFREYSLDGTEDVSYDDVAQRHGLKADDVRNYLRLVRQRGRETLRAMLRDYLFPGENVENELRFIVSR